jgi:myo-inositol-1(or 4)-monophosphatase
MFCISIGLALGDKPLVGVIHIPPLGEMFQGALGCGAHFGRKELRVSQRAELKDCLMTTGFAYVDEEKTLARELEGFKNISLKTRAVRRPGAAAIDLAYVAAGIFDGFWERNLSSWDICAGSLLVSEAGGKVTNFSGGTMKMKDREILASNSRIHPQMVSLLTGGTADAL